MKKLLRNVIKCNKCGEIIESKYTHDWVSCKCGGCYVDGGLEYQHLGGDFTNLVEYREVDDNEVFRD